MLVSEKQRKRKKRKKRRKSRWRGWAWLVGMVPNSDYVLRDGRRKALMVSGGARLGLRAFVACSCISEYLNYFVG